MKTCEETPTDWDQPASSILHSIREDDSESDDAEDTSTEDTDNETKGSAIESCFQKAGFSANTIDSDRDDDGDSDDIPLAQLASLCSEGVIDINIDDNLQTESCNPDEWENALLSEYKTSDSAAQLADSSSDDKACESESCDNDLNNKSVLDTCMLQRMRNFANQIDSDYLAHVAELISMTEDKLIESNNPGACMNAVSKSIFNKGGSNSGGSGSGAGDEPVDERLKGIEPKMIELIMNEIMDHGPQMSWDDIAGLEFAKKTIKEIVVWPMLRPDIFTGLRGPPKGLLLFGPPGTGKTLIGKCIASQSKSTFFSISASSLTSKWVGEAEKMVRAMFAVARCYQPAVVFIDEIDSLLSQRTDGEHEASRRIKTEFLVQLDGAATVSDDRILVIGATNRPQEIDEAARRRFVKRLYIPLPEGSARRQIVVNLLSQQTYQLTEAQLSAIEQRSDGYSGADVANLCREAALGPIRSMAFGEIENICADQVRPILFEDFDAAFMQVRASVSDKDLDLYIDWNNTYGSVPIRK
ncbi:hypothetical protein FSP39_016432 [Pinctada imbricata]|uniref:Fidgetin-like protein 1 n=1 Tax=Pinctada imbricata TaxID=66713 RepID=A0AA88Y1K7_PINIB|nr:hypothetical protein FSP39_016432 [Pinctada imbricata]